jgi:hypothetical protein
LTIDQTRVSLLNPDTWQCRAISSRQAFNLIAREFPENKKIVVKLLNVWNFQSRPTQIVQAHSFFEETPPLTPKPLTPKPLAVVLAGRAGTDLSERLARMPEVNPESYTSHPQP